MSYQSYQLKPSTEKQQVINAIDFLTILLDEFRRTADDIVAKFKYDDDGLYFLNIGKYKYTNRNLLINLN